MISLLCPTRRRPEGLLRLWESCSETATDWEIVAVTDPDDDSYRYMGNLPRIEWITARGDEVFSDLWNLAARHSTGDILQMAADDMVMRTEGWDRIVADAFPPDRIAFVYGDDCSPQRAEELGTLGFISRRWYDIVGRFCPPHFVSDYCDVWLNDVAKAIGRHIFVPVITEHMHFTWGKAPMDETYRANRKRFGEQNPPSVYAATAHEREVEAAKLMREIAKAGYDC